MARAKRVLPRLALIAVLLGGTGLRLDFARHVIVFEGDQNTIPLMALHISQGRDFPLYFYGQHYMGGIGPYVIAAVFVLLGPSDLALSLAMTLFSLLWVFALYLLFGRLIGKWAGVIAAAVAAFGPPSLIQTSVEPWIGYVSTFAYGTLIVYFGARLNDRDCSSRGEWDCVLGMGALAGLSIWTNPLCAPYLILGFGLLAAHVVRSRLSRAVMRKLAVAFLFFLVAVSPVIITGLRHGLGALFGFRASKLSLVPKVIGFVFTHYIPDFFGANASAPWPYPWLTAFPYIISHLVLVVGFIVGLAKRSRRLVRAALLPILFALIYSPFLLTNPLAGPNGLRYFLMFYLVIAASFAFPLALRRAWVSWVAATLAAIVALSNTAACIRTGRGTQRLRAADRHAARSELVERTEALGLRYVMHDTAEGHALTWAARERVIFAQPWGERYYPYVAGAVADDNASFCRPRHTTRIFKETLRTVGVIATEEFSVEDWTVFHGLVLPTKRFHLIEPVGASLIGANGETAAAALIDQDDETILGDRYDAETALTIDLGEATRLAGLRFVAPNEWDYPAGYTISGSLDGSDWFEIQRTEKRAATACIYGNRLFHRGRFTAMECRFPTGTANGLPSKPVRFVRIHGMRAPAPHYEVWRFRQAYFYREVGKGARPDEHEAAEITRMLRNSGVEFAVCDPWLSAKIGARSDTGLAVLPYYSNRHPHTHVSRVVPIRRGVAVVVENAHAKQAEKLLMDATLGDVAIEAHHSANYTAYIIADAPDGYESFPGLKWNGFTLVRTARIATAAWYHEHGIELERSGRRDKAERYFQRSFETYEGICKNLEKLETTDDEAHKALEKLTPEIATHCRFPYGISLIGYTLSPSPLVPGKTATLRLVWELEGKIPYDYLPVFVHFVGGNEIRFQADHNVRFPLAPRTIVPRCLILDEHTFTVPPDCPSGEVTIKLGALVWWDSSRRLKPRTKLPHRDRAVEIGTATISKR